MLNCGSYGINPRVSYLGDQNFQTYDAVHKLEEAVKTILTNLVEFFLKGDKEGASNCLKLLYKEGDHGSPLVKLN
jgi:hypothetical protein